MLGRSGEVGSPWGYAYCYKEFLLLGSTLPVNGEGRKKGAVGVAFEILFGADKLHSQINRTEPAGLTAGRSGMNLSFFRTIAAAISIAIAGQCCGQEEPGPASVELSFAGENKKTIVGLFGLTFNQSIECILTTSVNETEFGVQGWSISLAPDPGLDIVAITIEGTVAAGEDEGGRRRGGFERTELTQGEGNAGAVSAVVLAYVDLVTLPLTGTEVIARLDIQCPYPEVGVTETKVIRYVDGRQGSGEPVENVVAQADYDVEPELVPYEVVLLGIDENAVTYDCNSDGRVNIADAVCMLNWLFLGGPDPGCQDAMNFNGDARLNIADAISGLNFLFLGGPPPAAGVGCRSFPDCENEPSCL